MPAVTVRATVRQVEGRRVPAIGRREVERLQTREFAAVPGGHVEEYRCQHCAEKLLSRVPASEVRRAGGAVCPQCLVTGLVCAYARNAVIPGFRDPEFEGGRYTPTHLPKTGFRSTEKERETTGRKRDAATTLKARERARQYRARKSAPPSGPEAYRL